MNVISLSLSHGSSKQLCNVITDAARRLCTEHRDQITLQPFVACRLIPLAKNLGVQPIDICETLQRIIGKTIMQVVGHDIQIIAGRRQQCARQKSACEAAILAMHCQFDQEVVEGLLFVDASNTFNSLNCALILWNIQAICPSLQHM